MRASGTFKIINFVPTSLDGRSGAFNFVHSAATQGADRHNEFFAIVASSGTGALAGICGTGGMQVDSDGTHRVWFDYELP